MESAVKLTRNENDNNDDRLGTNGQFHMLHLVYYFGHYKMPANVNYGPHFVGLFEASTAAAFKGVNFISLLIRSSWLEQLNWEMGILDHEEAPEHRHSDEYGELGVARGNYSFWRRAGDLDYFYSNCLDAGVPPY